MFAARCIGISLALFLLLYVPLSVVASRGWRWVRRVLKPQSARGSANLLFVLRVAPFALACLFTLLFTLPSFLLLEPRSTNEAVGLDPALLGLCCLMLLAAGVFKAVSAQLKTSRALVRWLDGSTILEADSALPVFCSSNSPTLTVSGVREPKVLISEAAVAALTPPELRTALKHEVAHAKAYDNLKKLMFRVAFFPGMNTLERAWSEEAEFAADDAAVSSLPEALDLASALIKISRLAVAAPSAALATGLLHSAAALGVRVERLFAWRELPASPASNRAWFYAVPTLLAMLVVTVTTYSSALNGLHEVTEWLVR